MRVLDPRYGAKLVGSWMHLLLLLGQAVPLPEFPSFLRLVLPKCGVCAEHYWYCEVTSFLQIIMQEKNSSVKCFLIDPPGSGLFNKVTRGVMYNKEEAEGRRLKNPFDTITEGIGINRLTDNFKLAVLDDAFRGSDKDAVEMSRLV